jgi:SulP family sulfate permease
MGVALLTLALGFGAGLAALLTAFPLPILAGLLATAGLLHIGLLRDLRGLPAWVLALAVGLVGYQVHLVIALAGGLAVYWGVRGIGALAALRPRPA